MHDITKHDKCLNKFKNFLESRGAVVGVSNSPYEVLRFEIYGDLNIIYKNKHNQLTFSGKEAEKALKGWSKNKWNPPNRKRQQLTARKGRIAKRDGLKCFFCELPAESPKELTVEHLLSRKHGGTDNINNLALLCQPCNVTVGTLSITQKIKQGAKLKQKRLDNITLA